jgi:hypothetical protein
MNNENYEKDPRQKLSALLNKCGWREVTQGLWEKHDLRVLVDDMGLFLFRWLRSRWVRTHGLVHPTRETKTLVFTDGARLNLETGEFTGATQKLRRGNRR